MKDTIRRTKVVDALQSNDFGTKINVKGWVRTHRSSKAVDFIALNDRVGGSNPSTPTTRSCKSKELQDFFFISYSF